VIIPTDSIRKMIGSRIILKTRSNKDITGILHAFDDHLNMVMGDCEETDNNTGGKRNLEMMYLRGDVTVMVAKL
jgi:U6 snRNA-associated Sm-like protein LSm3